MSRLFHSFPRNSRESHYRTTEEIREDDAKAENIFESILRYGLLCTPEWLHIWPDPDTNIPEKRRLLSEGKPELSHSQSRMCFTLCEATELYDNRKLRQSGEVGRRTHSQIFGDWAIAFDPLVARRLGIVPTNYYSPSDMFGDHQKMGQTPGLNLQMIQRLKELRDLLIIMVHVESDLCVGDFKFESASILDELGISAPYELDCIAKVRSSDAAVRREVLEMFNCDRAPAIEMISFLDMIMGLFQQTDSARNGTPLEYYQQREWRLIHHMRQGTNWYSLGDQPPYRDPLKNARLKEVDALIELVSFDSIRTERFLQSCWLFESADGLPCSAYISDVIVPKRCKKRVQALMSDARINARLSDAENYGYRELTRRRPWFAGGAIG